MTPAELNAKARAIVVDGTPIIWDPTIRAGDCAYLIEAMRAQRCERYPDLPRWRLSVIEMGNGFSVAFNRYDGAPTPPDQATWSRSLWGAITEAAVKAVEGR